jgi:hypothetical protein
MITSKATAGMSGDGVYNRHSSFQREIVERSRSLLIAAVRQIGVVEPEFTVVDYGCGPGRNSVIAFRTVIGEYRKRSPDGVIVATHNDQIGNDWNDLFANVSGIDGYLSGDDAIRCQAAVGSFFEGVVSPRTVDLGMSFTAVQWLSGPVELRSPGTLYFADLEGEPRHRMAEIADRDWTQFLRKRAVELRSGGMLLVQCLGAVPDSAAVGGTDPGVRGLFQLMWEVASSLADDARLERGVLERFVMPQWFRTVDDARAPLDREWDLGRAFAIEELSVEPVTITFAEEYRRTGDADRYASDYTAFVRGFSERCLRDLLFAPSAGSAHSADELNDEYFSRLESRFRAEPGSHDYSVPSLTVLLRRG